MMVILWGKVFIVVSAILGECGIKVTDIGPKPWRNKKAYSMIILRREA